MNNIEEQIKMTFIGENSLGYENGKTYNLTINGSRELLNPKYKECPVVIERVGGGGLCAYSSLEKFMENWTLPNLLTQQREEAIKEIEEMAFDKEPSDITQEYQSVFLDGYNQAIEEVVELLTL